MVFALFYIFSRYNWIPRKVMKAIPISPVSMKVVPAPRSGAGTFE